MITKCGVLGGMYNWSPLDNTAHSQTTDSLGNALMPCLRPTNQSFFPSMMLTYVDRPAASMCAIECEHLCPTKPHNVIAMGGTVRQLKRAFWASYVLAPASRPLHGQLVFDVQGCQQGLCSPDRQLSHAQRV